MPDRPTVLVVDDDPTALEAVAAALEGTGYRVIRAGTGAEALALVDQQPPDAVVADLVTPDHDGARLVAALRERGLAIPAVLMGVSGEPHWDGARHPVPPPPALAGMLAAVARAVAAGGGDAD